MVTTSWNLSEASHSLSSLKLDSESCFSDVFQVVACDCTIYRLIELQGSHGWIRTGGCSVQKDTNRDRSEWGNLQLDRSMTILVLHAVCFLAISRVHKFKRLFVLIIRGGLAVFGKSGNISPRILCSKGLFISFEHPKGFFALGGDYYDTGVFLTDSQHSYSFSYSTSKDI